MPFDATYGQLLIAAAGANLAAALLQLVLVLLRGRRARKRKTSRRKPGGSLRMELRVDVERDLKF